MADFAAAREDMVESQRRVLEAYGTHFDRWVRERDVRRARLPEVTAPVDIAALTDCPGLVVAERRGAPSDAIEPPESADKAFREAGKIAEGPPASWRR